MSDEPRRRVSDAEEAQELRLINVFRKELADSRHELRNDLAVIRQEVQIGNLAQVSEFAQIKSAAAELATDVAELRAEQRAQRENFEPRLRKVEDATIAAVATGDLRKTLWRAAGVVCSVLIGTAAVLVAVLS